MGAWEAPKTSLSSLDQAVVTALTVIVCALLSWIAYTSYSNSTVIVKIEGQVQAIRENKDLGYLEKRVDAHDDRFENITSRLRIIENKVLNK